MENDKVKKLTILNLSSSVVSFMKEIVKGKEDEESFYVLDLHVPIQQYSCWKKNLPKVKPYYAMKCNDTKPFMEVLLALGTGFDCASRVEIEKALEIGATPDDIIFANPTKFVSHIQYAKKHGISLMTFDSVSELEKVKKHFPEARLVLRIKVDAENCLLALGEKFGCDPEKAVELLNYCKELGLTVVGVSFHVGTGCNEPEAYPRAIHIAAGLINEAQKKGIRMQYLDIGGGFPGDSLEMFEKNESKPPRKCLIWGQTEEKADKITNESWLPEMKIGDWLYFENMGAYSTVLSVGFHGFALPEIYPIIKEEEWIQLQKMISQRKKNNMKKCLIIKSNTKE